MVFELSDQIQRKMVILSRCVRFKPDNHDDQGCHRRVKPYKYTQGLDLDHIN